MFAHNSTPDTMLGGNGLALEVAPRTKVKLYFIAFKLVDKNGRMKNPLNIKNRQYTMPMIGESFEVDALVAKNIADRLQIYDPKLGFVQGVTTEAHIARAIRESFFAGTLTDLKTMQDIIQQGTLNTLSTEAIKQELIRRGELAVEEKVEENIAPAPVAKSAGASKEK